MKKADACIGWKGFIFDESIRVYTHPDGSRSSGPIYREHFKAVEITGETEKKWILDVYGLVISKANPQKRLYDEEDVEKKVWVHDNAYKLQARVGSGVSYAKLKMIEAILNGKEPKS